MYRKTENIPDFNEWHLMYLQRFDLCDSIITQASTAQLDLGSDSKAYM